MIHYTIQTQSHHATILSIIDIPSIITETSHSYFQTKVNQQK